MPEGVHGKIIEFRKRESLKDSKTTETKGRDGVIAPTVFFGWF
jgi:hypothetical protein